jgi:xanthine dehydrogenase large subunit
VGTLHLAPDRAPAARGRIVRIDLEAVRKVPGVIAVLTAADIPGRNDVSPGMGDDPMLAADTIEFDGQVVFAMVAETRDIARRAAPRVSARSRSPFPARTTC